MNLFKAERVKDYVARLAKGLDGAAGETGREPGGVAIEIVREPGDYSLIVDGIEEGLSVHGHPRAKTVARRFRCGYRHPRRQRSCLLWFLVVPVHPLRCGNTRELLDLRESVHPRTHSSGPRW